MSMIKQGASFQQGVVDVIDGGESVCEKCGNELNLMESSEGNIPCNQCGHSNRIEDMESTNE